MATEPEGKTTEMVVPEVTEPKVIPFNSAEITTETVTLSKAELTKMQAALKEANKEEAKRRIRLEELEAAEIERKQAAMTESEKAAAKFKEVENENAQLKRAMLVRKIADEAGLPSALADRLQGNTEEELKADAAKLLELVPKSDPKKPNLQVSNPGNAERVETMAEKRTRLMGSPVDIWSGGGINAPGQ